MKKSVVLLFVSMTFLVYGQERLTFQKPSAEILALADYQRPPAIQISPDKTWLLFMYRPTYKSLEELGQEEVRLAGLRINPKTRISSRETYYNNLRLKNLADNKEFEIQDLPPDALLSNIAFSPDAQKVAFTNTTDKGVALWVVDVTTQRAKQLTDYELNAVLDEPYKWFRDSKQLLVSKLPSDQKPLVDRRHDLPQGPAVATSDGQISQLRTYQDLLKNPQDEQDFEHLATSELHGVDLNGNQRKLLDAAMYLKSSFSPDGQYILTTVLKRPFSYIVRYTSFPQETTVYDVNGKLLKRVNELPLIEVMPKGFSSVRAGRRSMGWRQDKPASLFFVEALDGGDANVEATYRDELFSWDAPFSSPPRSLMKIADRYAGTTWGNDQYALVYSQWYDTRNVKTFVLNPTTGESKIIDDRNRQDIYADPGDVFRDKSQYGTYTMHIHNDKTYWLGRGFTEEGEFPFIDELD